MLEESNSVEKVIFYKYDNNLLRKKNLKFSKKIYNYFKKLNIKFIMPLNLIVNISNEN